MVLLVSLLIQVAAKGGVPAAGLAPINDLQAFVMGSSVELSCTCPPDNAGAGVPIDDVVIRYSTGGALQSEADWDGAVTVYSTSEAGLTLRSGDAVTFVTDDLPDGEYWFVARAKDVSGWSGFPDPAPASVIIGGGGGGGLVPTVTGLSVVPGSATTSSVQLTWNALTGTAAQVMIYRGSSLPTTAALTDWVSGTTTVTITGLDSSTTYSFGAKARNAALVESLMSAAPYAMATTLAGAGPGPGPESGGGSSSGCPQSATGSAAAWMLVMAGLVLRRSLR